jgi:hypothetical protein
MNLAENMILYLVIYFYLCRFHVTYILLFFKLENNYN